MLHKKGDLDSGDQGIPLDAFLGVTRSLREFTWRDRLEPTQQHIATAISQRYNLPELLGRVLVSRGVDLEGVSLFLEPTLKSLMPDPSAMQDMDQGVERIADAIEKQQNIAIFGDYDVDGASSSSLLHRLFAAHGLDSKIYIPDRIFEGYGPNTAAIENLIADGAQVIITVDCGSTSHEPLGIAKSKGVDVVIIDHHQADITLPDVHSVINPNRQDDLSGLGHLAAAGVVFMVIVAVVRTLRKRGFYTGTRTAPDLLQWLDIVALATICDVVPLQGLNRAFVTKGLQVMKHRQNAGLRALCDIASLKSAPTPYHLGFVLGPRINAGGRIGKADLGAQLLCTHDEQQAEKIAATLDKLNAERKALENETLEDALSQAEFTLNQEPDMPVLITASEGWHKGLIGLVASRLTEKFRRPSVVISWTAENEGTGSARSIGGVDLGAVIRAAVTDGILVKGGGHTMAAGLTVQRDRFDDFKSFLTQKLAGDVSQAMDTACFDVDGALTPNSVSIDLMNLLDRAGPYGQGNPMPRFVFPAHQISFAKVIGENHVKCTLMAGDGSKIDAIAFRALGTPIGDALLGNKGQMFHIAGHLTRNTWGGRERVELIVDDVALA
ncbi:MAG: single-stranded-DNA-specific exonuclease RecJ [Pseudomonadota bacterium]